ITGAPKIRAMEIIEELEPSRRNLYCGSMGYISQDGKMDTSILIRTLMAEQNKLYCWAGGGIVADSVAEAEYQESFDKVSRILPILKQ
ncbi:MAG: chorismate-binding protein, partial [Shewanella sp.]|nr:chorismate-binding protein [Shewanella sp.]